MEQLIGMTDTAFMGRVGEVELGASAIAGEKKIDHFCSRERGRSVRPTKITGSSRQPERGGNKT